MDRSQVEKCVKDFHLFPSEIRDNIPSIVSAAMEVIHLKFKSIKTSRKNSFAAPEVAKTEVVSVRQFCFLNVLLKFQSFSNPTLYFILQFLNELRTKAHAIVTFCGMIPYFMTNDIYIKIIQIEVQMN